MSVSNPNFSVARFVDFPNVTFTSFLHELASLYCSLHNQAQEIDWGTVIEPSICNTDHWWYRICTGRSRDQMMTMKSEWRRLNTYYSYGAMVTDLKNKANDEMAWAQFCNTPELPITFEPHLNDPNDMTCSQVGLIELLQMSPRQRPVIFPAQSTVSPTCQSPSNSISTQIEKLSDLSFVAPASNSPPQPELNGNEANLFKPVRYYHAMTHRGPQSVPIPLLPSGGVTSGWPRIPLNKFNRPVEFGTAPLVPTDAYPLLRTWFNGPALQGARMVPWEDALHEPKSKNSRRKEKKEQAMMLMAALETLYETDEEEEIVDQIF